MMSLVLRCVLIYQLDDMMSHIYDDDEDTPKGDLSKDLIWLVQFM